MPPEASPALEIHVNGRRVVRIALVVCIAAELAFVVLDYWVNYSRAIEAGPIRRLFNITREDGLASWFAITQTWMLALTMWAMVIISRSAARTRATERSSEPEAAKPGRPRSAWWGWLILALLFTYMAADDGATIHERLGSTLKQSQAAGAATADFPSYHWHIIFVPPLALLGLFMLWFLVREFSTTMLRLAVLVALACMAFAVGLDVIEGLEPDHRWNLYTHIAERYDFEDFTRRQFQTGEFTALVHFSKSLEETAEMFAITLLWTATLAHLVRAAPDMRLRLASPPQP